MRGSVKGNLLVAVINSKNDLNVLLNKKVYRIPVASFNKYLKNKWVPEFICFYQTLLFKEEGYRINYIARVLTFQEVKRQEIFPDEMPDAPKFDKKYYLFSVDKIQKLDSSIISRRRRRINFIISNTYLFESAKEINDLYIGNRMENKLWSALKKNKIIAEREEFVRARGKYYAIDFSVYCNKGKIAIETDGDFWHISKEKAREDNNRDNDLKTAGWQVLRFSEEQVLKHMNKECMPIIKENVKNYGGVESLK